MKIRYHSVVADALGCHEENEELTSGVRAIDFFQSRANQENRYKFITDNKEAFIVSVNNELTSNWTTKKLSNNDVIDIFVPMAGG